MRKLLMISLAVNLFILSSCNNNNQHNKNGELDLKQNELNLKEKGLEISKRTQASMQNSNMTDRKEKKKLRYLYYANGGIVGYFDNGTIAGCPRCDFCRTNILVIFNAQPIGTYIVESDGSLLINNSERIFPKINKRDRLNNWALIDYKWNEKVPQY